MSRSGPLFGGRPMAFQLGRPLISNQRTLAKLGPPLASEDTNQHPR